MLFSIACFLSFLHLTVTQLLIFLKARITELQVGVPGVWAGVVECESCHGTQSTYHAKCRRERSSGPGRPSIPGKLIVINQVTETEQGLANDCLSPLPLLLPPPLLLFHHLIQFFPDAVFIHTEEETANKQSDKNNGCRI